MLWIYHHLFSYSYRCEVGRHSQSITLRRAGSQNFFKNYSKYNIKATALKLWLSFLSTYSYGSPSHRLELAPHTIPQRGHSQSITLRRARVLIKNKKIHNIIAVDLSIFIFLLIPANLYRHEPRAIALAFTYFRSHQLGTII